MLAIDRDGCLVGKLGDFEAGHPKNYKSEKMPIIKEAQRALVDVPFVVISNQQGIQNGYVSEELVIKQFLWLKDQFPSCLASVFCPDDGQSAIWVFRSSIYRKVEIVKKESDILGFYRKPNAGMAISAKNMGFKLSRYVGDLSGNPTYGNGRDSDRRFAENAGIEYLDIQEFLAESKLMPCLT